MASNPNYCDITPEIEALAAQSLQNSSIDAGDYVRYDVCLLYTSPSPRD